MTNLLQKYSRSPCIDSLSSVETSTLTLIYDVIGFAISFPDVVIKID